MSSSPPSSSVAPGRGEIALPADMSEKSVWVWLEDLPLANIDYSAQALLQLLRKVTQSGDFSCEERLRLLELLRKPLYMLADRGLEMHLGSDVSFPLPRAARRSTNLGFLLCQEFARAYRQVVDSKDFFSNWALEESARTLTIYRALEAYGESLQKSLVTYTPPPRGYWQDVYVLYRLAEERGMLTWRIAGAQSERTSDTILRRFKHIVLFALANSQRHRPLEIRQIHTITGQFAHLAELSEVSATDHDQALFQVVLNSDAPPRPLLAGAENEKYESRYLFTRIMARQALKHYKDPANRRWGGLRMRRAMLKRLLHSLGAPERRKSRRFPLQAERVLTVGLNALTTVVGAHAGKTQAPSTGGITVQVRGITLLNVPDYSLEAITSPSSRNEARDARSEGEIARQLHDDKSQLKREDIWKDNGMTLGQPEHDTSIPRASLVNFSARGYCLCWVNSDLSCLRIDEVIGIPSEDDSLNIGVIRWLSHDATNNLLLGVQLLAPVATPVSIGVSASFDEERRGLLLPINAGLGLSASLLTPPACFQIGQIVRLQTAASETRSVRLEKLIETNFSYSHFEVADSET